MFKIVSMLLSVMAVVGTMLSVKYVNKFRLPDQGQIIQQFANVTGKQDDALKLITGQKTPAPTLNASAGGFNIASILGGGVPTPDAAAQTAPKEPEEPAGPYTAIMYKNNGKDDQDDTADAEVRELPPGAQAVFVDGRLQIFYPNGKPSK
jgi:hypothetical protein